MAYYSHADERTSSFARLCAGMHHTNGCSVYQFSLVVRLYFRRALSRQIPAN
jgi:hypothetical protein